VTFFAGGGFLPCRYVIDKERRLVISIGWGLLTYDEIKAHDDQLENDHDFKPEFDQLADLTKVATLDISAEQGKTIARRNLFSGTSRRAWVASDPSIYGMGRLMATYHEMALNSSDGRAFYDLPAALKWLGLSEGSINFSPQNLES
jgi:hypothetical protein